MKEFHEHEPGELLERLKSDQDQATVWTFLISEIRVELQLFEQNGKVEHIWRAWRTARAMGELPIEVYELLSPYIDLLAYDDSKRTGSAADAVNRNYKLLNYYHEVQRWKDGVEGAATSWKECYKRVADRFNTSQESVKQMVLEHEGRGQRGKRKKR